MKQTKICATIEILIKCKFLFGIVRLFLEDKI